MRKAAVKRKTKETDVEVAVDLDGTGVSQIATGIGFFDHMLDLLARPGGSRLVSVNGFCRERRCPNRRTSAWPGSTANS